jgi:DNA-directed RNA polymerase specialized sigma24 family protein
MSTAELNSAREDEALVVRCLRNDEHAWESLFELCHPRMLARICHLLGKRSTSLEMAQEIAAVVWVSIVADEGRVLRRYSAVEGARLTTYINGIAVKKALSYLRQSKRRQNCETEYAGKNRNLLHVGTPSPLDFQDFVQHLTPKETVFFHSELNSSSKGTAASELSAENTWQLRHRIRRKLHRFLWDER